MRDRRDDMKKKNILISIVAISIVFMISFPTISHAGTWGDIFKGADDFVSKGNVMIDESKLEDASASMYYILLYIGIATASIMGVVLGIKFMSASAEDKAKVKEQLIPYVIGCVIVFGAFAIWKLVVTVMNNVV